MRFSAFVNARGRRAIPLHWNERAQYPRKGAMWTEFNRCDNKSRRNASNATLASYRGDWDDFDGVTRRAFQIVDEHL